jgi:hypothetical protein
MIGIFVPMQAYLIDSFPATSVLADEPEQIFDVNF